ncbi:MAG: hypothetical protein HKN40_12305 [Winogradskyella sp.]|uniref:hypothetical protein n=1 Tax=Winogradskyella sp. TaxID=1883156 RepID=UPI0017F73531|nr:hypothetical protein [Winogradskyella sp.]
MKKNKIHNISATGFKVPDNYFESFDAKLNERIKDQDLIEGIKTPGFTIPNNYFEGVDNQVFKKLQEEEKPVIQLFNRRSYLVVASLAASIIFLFSIFINGESNDESLSIDMVEAYLENRDLSSYELAQLLSDADLLEENFTIATPQYDQENLEDYLLENVDLEHFID